MRYAIAVRAMAFLFVLVVAAPTATRTMIETVNAPAAVAATETATAVTTETATATATQTATATDIETATTSTEAATQTATATDIETATTSTEAATQTATATETATEMETATTTATETATATATATSVAPINADTLMLVAPSGPIALQSSESATLTVTYTVTTPRTGTAIHAELRDAGGASASGWNISVQAGAGEWVGGVAAVDVTESGTLVPDATFTLSFVVMAPADVTAEQTASLYISSTATTDHGDETGVVAAGPLVSLTGVPPPPAANSLSCDALATTEIAPGGVAEMPCLYAVNDPAIASVTTAFETVRGDGWTLAIGDGPADETATWTPAEPLVVGATVDLVVRVTAPAGARAGQQASVTVAGDGTDPTVAWTLTVAAPVDVGNEGGFSVMSVDPEGGICTQTQPDGDILPGGVIAVFQCGRGGLDQTKLDVIRISRPPAGWHYSVNGGQLRDVGYYTSSPLDLLPNADSTFSIGLVRDLDTIDESVGSVTVEYFRWSCGFGGTNCSEVLERSATLSITWPTPDVMCDPISPPGAVVGPSEYATFKCTHTNPPFRLTDQTSIDSHWVWAVSTGKTPVFPQGWSYGPIRSSPTTDAVFVYVKHNPYNPPEPSTVQDIQVVFRQDGSNIETQKTLTVTYPATACDPGISLAAGTDFGASRWDGNGYSPVTGTLGVTILAGDGTDCSGFTDDWSVQISSDGMTDGGTGSIAASDIAWIVSDAPAGMTEVPTNQPLAATGTTKIADGSASVLPGATWDITLQLQPPSDAPPGDYTGTITVTIASGD